MAPTDTASPTPAQFDPTSTLAPIPTNTATPTVTPTPTITPTPTRFLGPETIEIGQSMENRPIEVVRFGDGEDALVLIGGLHAGFAPASVLLAEEMIIYFEENMDQVPDNVAVYVIANANPDAERFPGVVTGRLNANGVDLNRNWDCRWRSDAVWANQPVSGGLAPFSELETIALRDFIVQRQPRAVVFWQAKAAGGLASPGACGIVPRVSSKLAQLYGDSADYQVADFENLTNTVITGDSTNWLDDQDLPAITVLLPEYGLLSDRDLEDNLTAVLVLLDDLAAD